MLMWVSPYWIGAVLREDRDAAFLLDVSRVHDAFGDLLVFAEGAGLAQQLVDEGGLAVVNVGDDGDVADGAGHGEGGKSLKGRGFYHVLWRAQHGFVSGAC